MVIFPTNALKFLCIFLIYPIVVSHVLIRIIFRKAEGAAEASRSERSEIRDKDMDYSNAQSSQYDLPVREIELFINKRPSKESMIQIGLIVYENYRDSPDFKNIVIEGRDALRIVTEKLSENVINRILLYIRQFSDKNSVV